MELKALGIFSFAALIIIVLGIAVKYFKAYWLISGYNTMSKEKRKNVDIEGLASFICNFCFLLGAIIFLGGLLVAAGKAIIGLLVFALVVPASIYELIKAQKYDGNTRNPDGNMNIKTKVIVGSISLLLVGAVIGVGVLIYHSNKPTEFTVTNGYLQIHGLYGERVNIDEVNEISLKDSMPSIKYKSNGSSLGSKKKGIFILEGFESAKLFVDDSKPPFIFINTNSKLIILNCINPEQTKVLHSALMSEWK